MTSDRAVPLTVVGILGILAPVASFGGIILAVLQAPWFSMTYSWLSDLGVDPRAAAWFNGGLIVAGIIGVLFALGLRRLPLFASTTGTLGIIVLAIGLVALAGVGIITEDYGSAHTLVAFTFFICAGVSVLLLGAAGRQAMPGFGRAMSVLGVLSLASLPLLTAPRPYGSNALVELIPSITVSIFSVAVGIMLITGTIRELSS